MTLHYRTVTQLCSEVFTASSHIKKNGTKPNFDAYIAIWMVIITHKEGLHAGMIAHSAYRDQDEIDHSDHVPWTGCQHFSGTGRVKDFINAAPPVPMLRNF